MKMMKVKLLIVIFITLMASGCIAESQLESQAEAQAYCAANPNNADCVKAKQDGEI